MHKAANVPNKPPEALQPRAKQHLLEIRRAETSKDAQAAFEFFLEAYGPKHDKAAACLEKDRHVLLSVRDFPAEHWTQLRGTNPVESSFATVRLTTTKSKGCLSASKKWRRFDGAHPFAEIVRGLTFKDGEKLTQRAA